MNALYKFVLVFLIVFTDIFGSREQWVSIQDEILTGLSPDVMEAYGEEYIRSMQQRLVEMSSTSSPNTEPFLEALKHALLSTRPKPFYYPGAAAWALILFYRYCPTSLSDRVFSRMFMTSYAKPTKLWIMSNVLFKQQFLPDLIPFSTG